MKRLYQLFGYFGLASIFGSMLYGFRFDPSAPQENIYFNLGLYGLFVVPHLVMTRRWFKKAVWGSASGSTGERQVYITISILSWILVFAYHRPIPGPIVWVPEWLRFMGMLGFVLSIMAFFEGVTFPMLDGLLGAPGTSVSHSHGPETPLFTEGPYARVRHPMYRAAIFSGLCSLIFHPQAGQLLWALLIGGTFVAFIPVEERQMIAARGNDYEAYREKTRYRLFRGLW
jgi:protein-S-isoprenylcysteine O-methyltransferase Ste14